VRWRLIEAWVADYDGALKAGDNEAAARVAAGLRGLGVRV
jgi:hypothetical protein